MVRIRRRQPPVTGRTFCSTSPPAPPAPTACGAISTPTRWTAAPATTSSPAAVSATPISSSSATATTLSVDDNQFILGTGFVTVDTTPDVLRFGPGIAPADIQFVRDGKDLTLIVGSGGDSITLQGQDDYFHTGVFGAISYNRIEEVRFEDGTVWTWQQLNARDPALSTTSGQRRGPGLHDGRPVRVQRRRRRDDRRRQRRHLFVRPRLGPRHHPRGRLEHPLRRL